MKTKPSLMFLSKSGTTGLRPVSTRLFVILALSSVLFALSPPPFALSQIPQGFNYQAIARDGSGNPISTPIDVKIAILSSENDVDVIWEELHAGVDPDDHGLFSIVVGKGVTQPGGLASFSLIDWTVTPKYIRTKINDVKLGTAQLYSVPYAMVADSLGGPLSKLKVKGSAGSTLEEALFEVKNKTGQTVFAVYNEGVRIYVDDGEIKSKKGGFSVGSFGTETKGVSQPLLVVDPDSIRAYVYDDPLLKAPKGGFSVGGFNALKGYTNDYLMVSPDCVRVYVDNRPSTKGAKGGFSVGGFDVVGKGETQKFLTVSNDSVRIYIDDISKGAKGGFSVGGFNQDKGNASFLNVSTDAEGIIDPSENRILWYPLKNAFLTGKVLVEDKDSVGENSFASGFESKAKGMYSQALGYNAIARGDYSTAIGKNAVVNGLNSFAFGDNSKSIADNSYSFGRNAQAIEDGSFAFGSIGIDTLGAMLSTPTIASGKYSFAIGLGSRANSIGSVSLGTNSQSVGIFSYSLGFEASTSNSFSYSMGYQASASGYSSLALGYQSNASGSYATAIGKQAISSGIGSIAIGQQSQSLETQGVALGNLAISEMKYSSAIGYKANSKGIVSTSIGWGTVAQSYASIALGAWNHAEGDQATWVDSDPILSVGIGTAEIQRKNALTVFKDGHSIFAGDIYIRNGYTHTGNYLIRAYGTSGNGLLDLYYSNSVNARINSYGSSFLNGGSLGIGTNTPAAQLTVVDNDESTSLPSFTQNINNAGLLMQTEYYSLGAYTPGLFWSTSNNNPTKPKAGIWLYEDGSGTDLYFGTSNSYATGITNNGMILDQGGSLILGGGLNVTSGITSGSNLSVSGNLSSGGNLNVTGTMTSGGNLTVSGGTIYGINGGTSIGSATSGWYSDNTNIAARFPGASGDFYIQNSGGSMTYLRAGAGIYGLRLFLGNALFDNYVGIGTSNPLNRLHIIDNSFNTGAVRSESKYSGTSSHYAGYFDANSGSIGIGVWASGSLYDFFAGGPGSDYGTSSSIRWKRNIANIEEAIDKVLNIRGVYFDWDYEHGGGHDIGFIGEELFKVLPEIVIKDPKDPKYVLGLDYGAITPLLVEAIKEQQHQIESVKQENQLLKSELQSIRDEMEQIKAMVVNN